MSIYRFSLRVTRRPIKASPSSYDSSFALCLLSSRSCRRSPRKEKKQGNEGDCRRLIRLLPSLAWEDACSLPLVLGLMASEDVVGKSTGDSAVTTIVNLAEEAKLAREGVKAPGHAILSICKSLACESSGSPFLETLPSSNSRLLFSFLRIAVFSYFPIVGKT
ncbi:Mitochondrial substrate carrier family protein [Musa troglodytarum]|uniref:Mitochondrial substrate carrier family protein n=1 Tax=Musa troglodytarum TaxID=320322 RepID=A0A9E7GSV4_9LILI|nr:Mitochondrial substrate carrier family protein [Musa troglodytarum]